MFITGVDSELKSVDSSSDTVNHVYVTVKSTDENNNYQDNNNQDRNNNDHASDKGDKFNISTGANINADRAAYNPYIFILTCFRLIKSSRQMLFIVALYAVSNLAALSALEHLGAGVYNTVTQLKILTTALFSKILLNREYSFGKWRALVMC